MNMNVIETSGLGKRYGHTWALRECSLAIPAGHVAALVGPNGAGKTTLLNLAVGLAEPTAGGVTVLGGRAPAAAGGRAARADRGRRHGARRPARGVPGGAGRHRVRRPGHPGVQEPAGRG